MTEQDLLEAVRKSGHEYAKWQSKWEMLDDQRHIVLSECKNNEESLLVANGEKIVESKIERLARTDDDYRKHIKDKKEAREKALTNRAEYDIYMAMLNRMNSKDFLAGQECKVHGYAQGN